MKRILSITIVATLVVLWSMPVFAHCSQGARFYSNSNYNYEYNYCEIEDCEIAGYHDHDGVYCYGHAYNDGHDYHGYCDYAGCTLTGYHGHDGEYCFGRRVNSGYYNGYYYSGRGCH